MLWNTTIKYMELFFLPTLAALAASFAIQGTVKQRGGRVISIFVIAYIVALLGQFAQSRTAKPSSMTVGPDLLLDYDVRTSRIAFRYKVLIYADSSSGFTSVDLTGSLKSVDQYQSVELPFALRDFDCSDDRKPIELPHFIAPSMTQHLDCSVSSILTKTQAMNLVVAGSHKFTFMIAANSSNQLTGQYCFDLTADSVRDSATSGNLHRRFIDAKC